MADGVDAGQLSDSKSRYPKRFRFSLPVSLPPCRRLLCLVQIHYINWGLLALEPPGGVLKVKYSWLHARLIKLES